jgi:hypothetical protein
MTTQAQMREKRISKKHGLGVEGGMKYQLLQDAGNFLSG